MKIGICPRCNKESLEYRLEFKSAFCLSTTQCGYVEPIKNRETFEQKYLTEEQRRGNGHLISLLPGESETITERILRDTKNESTI